MKTTPRDHNVFPRSQETIWRCKFGRSMSGAKRRERRDAARDSFDGAAKDFLI